MHKNRLSIVFFVNEIVQSAAGRRVLKKQPILPNKTENHFSPYPRSQKLYKMAHKTLNSKSQDLDFC
jgi:hypothetical protein